MSRLQDQRKRPLTIDWELDDMPLSSRAFRVYGHLIRRAGVDGAIFPSYASIGEHCFKGDMPDAKPESRRNAAIRAVKELQDHKLVKVIKRKDEQNDSNHSNFYVLTDKSEWVKVVMSDTPPSDVTSLPLVISHHYPSDVTSPKGTTNEDTTNYKISSFNENDTLDIDQKHSAGFDEFFNAWNNFCGSLPKVRKNSEAEKLIKRELKNRTSFELVEAIQMGARVVSADPFWQKNKYGLVNLLRHLDSKVEVNESNGGFVGADATAFSLASGIWDAVK